MNVLIAALGSVEIDWVGTSLVGLIGIVLAALPGSPIRRIVINDIGPYLPWAGLLRLGANLNDAPKGFDTMRAAELYFRRVLAPFGEIEDEHWRHLTVHQGWRMAAIFYGVRRRMTVSAQHVKKRSGYEYPGFIVSVFTNRAGAVRYVTACLLWVKPGLQCGPEPLPLCPQERTSRNGMATFNATDLMSLDPSGNQSVYEARSLLVV